MDYKSYIHASLHDVNEMNTINSRSSANEVTEKITIKI
jgi:hypothetical protein